MNGGNFMEDRKAFVRSFYGENHPITGDYE